MALCSGGTDGLHTATGGGKGIVSEIINLVL